MKRFPLFLLLLIGTLSWTSDILAQLPGGPVVHMKFDEPPGAHIVHDTSGNATIPMPTGGGASFVSGGIAGNALSLNSAQNGFLDLGNSVLDASRSFTVALWLQIGVGDTRDMTPWLAFVNASPSGANGGWLRVGSYSVTGASGTTVFPNLGRPAFLLNWTNAVNTQVVINDGRWHHVVCVYDAASRRQNMYVNGVLEASRLAPAVNDHGGDFLLGGFHTIAQTKIANYDGLLDDFQLYQRALTTTEVEFVYRNPGLSAGVSSLGGSVDNDFAPAGFGNVGANPVTVSKMHSLFNGRLLVSGSFSTYNGISAPNFARINPDGSLDTSFFHGFGASAEVRDFVVQPDGRIVVVGAFEAFQEIFLPRVARMGPDGRPDPSFLPGAGANGVVHSVALQSNGSMIIGGEFSSFAGTNRAGIARLFANGRLDTSFDPGAGVNGTVYEVQILPNGQVLVGGTFTSVNGIARNGLVLLNSDGSVDQAFNSPFEPSAKVTELIRSPTGQILASGLFNLIGSNGRRNVARLNADGSLDSTYGSSGLTSGPNGEVRAMTLCSDGALLVGGDFTTYDGLVRGRMAKLGTNGLVDNTGFEQLTSFQVTNTVVLTNLAPIIQTNATPPSTNILFGFFSNTVFVTVSTNTNSLGTNQISFVTTNDVVNTAFAVTGIDPDANFFGLLGGANASVTELALDSLGAPYAGGSFTNVNGESRSGLVKLAPCVPGGGGITIAGTIVDATTGQGIAGVSVSTLNEIASTASDGSFTLVNASSGTNALELVRAGYYSATNHIFISSNTTLTNLAFTMSPGIQSSNVIRLVLTWGANPTDLDSWLDTPAISNTAHTVNFITPGSVTAPPFAFLDVDDTFSFGPETITITNLVPGIYNYYINDFTQSGRFASVSQAKIEIYTVAGLVNTIRIPTGSGQGGSGGSGGTGGSGGQGGQTGSGDWWHVLQINGSNGTYAVINNISNAQPTINTNVSYNLSFGSVALGGGVGAPTILQQPTDEFAISGGSANLAVNVSGSQPFSYQWYHNGSPIAGANSATLPISPLTTANAGAYHVVITNILGAVTSKVAQVTALSATSPFVFVQPRDTVVDTGGQVSLEVLAGGERPLFYQWRHNGTNVPNAKGALLTLTNATAEDSGLYDIIVANSRGITFSQPANLLVSTPPGILGFNATPGTNVSAGEAVTMGIGVEGKPPFNFTWLFNGQVLPSALSSNLSIQQVHFTNSGDYQVIVTNALGAATNPPVTLTVNSAPLIITEPQNQFQTVGRAATLNVGAIGSQPISYQWRVGGTNIAGATSSNLLFTNIQADNVGFYTVVMSNQFGLATSRVARVDVVLERAVLPWLQNFGGTGRDVGQAIGTDSAGNVYTVGRFAGTAQFGTNSLSSAGVDDIFITKMDANGNVIWAKRFGGAGYDVANDVVVLPSGDVFITGSFERIADFGGTSVTNTTVSSFSDLFVARVDASGNVVWVRTEGVQFFADVGTSVAIDGSTNVYVTGSSTLANFNNAPIANTGRVLLAKYDAGGNRIWARKAGAGNGGSQDRGLGVAVAPDGSVYNVGVFYSATLTNSASVLTNRSNPGFSDGFIAKYDSAGTLQWLRQIGGTGIDTAESVVVTVDSNVLVAGQLSATNTIGTNEVVSRGGTLPDACLINLDTAGEVRWVRQFGGTGSDAAMDVAADPRGNIYLTGFFQGSATFGSKTVESIAATKDVFVAGVRSDGTVEFVQQAGGDSIAGESGLGVAVDVNGGGVFTGRFQGTFVAGGDSKTSNGGDNVFVSRLVSPAPTMAATTSTNGNVTFSWSSFRAGFVLEANGATLNSSNWTTIPITPSVVDGSFVFSTNTSTTNVLFLRLRQP